MRDIFLTRRKNVHKIGKSQLLFAVQDYQASTHTLGSEHRTETWFILPNNILRLGSQSPDLRHFEYLTPH